MYISEIQTYISKLYIFVTGLLPRISNYEITGYSISSQVL